MNVATRWGCVAGHPAMTRLKAAVMVLLAGGVAATGWATDTVATPASRAVSTSASAPGGRILKFPYITADLDARRIVVQSEICNRDCLLEMLLCRKGGKQHESILCTQARPSHLHAALLALGLERGIAGEWVGPAEEGRYLPPRGEAVRIRLRWRTPPGPDGKSEVRLSDPGEWMTRTDLKGRSLPLPPTWIFVGSQITPEGQYAADLPDRDHIICVSNWNDAVLDVPFESSESNALLEFRTVTDKIPPLQTPVDVVIEPVTKESASPYARALLEIDADGRLMVENEPVTPEELELWASKFSQVHPRGQVEIHAAARATMYDVAVAKALLRRGGVFDFREEVREPDGAVLPRTAEQLKAEMDDWRRRLANPMDYIGDPRERAAGMLKDIQRQIDGLAVRRRLWEEYSRSIQQAVGVSLPASGAASQAVQGQP